MNEGQRRYAMEQYNLALVRRGLPIDHPIPEESGGESEYETAHEESDTETLVGDTQETGGYETADELEDELHEATPDMPPPGKPSSGAGSQVAGPSGTGKGGKGIKRTNTGESGFSDDGFGLPGTGRDQGESAPSDVPGTRTVALPKPITGLNTYIRHFRKVHRFISWGVSYQIIETKIGNITYRNITTPFANLPWDKIYFYLNPSEFDGLPNGSWVTKVRVEVKARNVRVAFPTNSTATELATLNQNKDICYAVGLNKKIPTINVQYKAFQDSQPMIPTDFEVDAESKHTDFMGDLYGKPWAVTPLTVPRHQMGIPTPLHAYAIIPYAHDEPESGYPCLQSYYKDFDADAMTGQTVLREEYKPICSFIRRNLTPIYHPYPVVKKDDFITVQRQGGTNQFSTDKIKMDTANQPATLTDEPVGTWTATNWQPEMTSEIEKSQNLRFGNNGMKPVGAQPSIHIAVQPTPALDTKALQGKSNSSFTDTQAYWEVIAEMEVNTKYPHPFPLYPGPHADHFDQAWVRSGNQIDPYITMYQGLYCNREAAPQENGQSSK